MHILANGGHGWPARGCTGRTQTEALMDKKRACRPASWQGNGKRRYQRTEDRGQRAAQKGYPISALSCLEMCLQKPQVL